jgi:tetratricopeptide (TPR) repeat protein
MGVNEHPFKILRKRLQRVAATNDLSLALEQEALAEGNAAIKAGKSDGHLQACFLVGQLLYYRHLALGRSQGQKELDQSITFFTQCFIQAMKDIPPPLLPMVANRAIPTALRSYDDYYGSGNLDRIGATAYLLQRIRAELPVDHPQRPAVVSRLTGMLSEQFEITGSIDYIEKSIQVGREELSAPSGSITDEPWLFLYNLADDLLDRFDHLGLREDLDEAVLLCRQAVEGMSGTPLERMAFLRGLGNALMLRCAITAQGADEAVAACEKALEAAPADDSLRAMCYSTLGNALLQRFEIAGRSADVDRSVASHRAALRIAPMDADGRAGYLHNLSTALWARSGHYGPLADLDEAIEVGRAALAANPGRHRADILAELGNRLSHRAKKTGSTADYDDAVSAGEEAVQLTSPGNVARAVHLSMLGVSLRLRFEALRNPGDLNEAIRVSKVAAHAVSVDDPNRGVILMNLGNALRIAIHPDTQVDGGDEDGASLLAGDLDLSSISSWQKRTHFRDVLGLRRKVGARVVSQLDEALKALRAAVAATVVDQPSWFGGMSDLGKVLEVRFEHTGRQDDLNEAVSAYEQVVQADLAAPYLRIQSAHAAAKLIARSRPGHAARLLETAVHVLPAMASRRLSRGDQQYALQDLAGLVEEAASLALANTADPERARRALELLEMGRAVLFSQTLDARDDLTDLRREHPGLAVRYWELCNLLDRDENLDTSNLTGHAVSAESAEDKVNERRRYAAELEETLVSIRSMEGFSTFGLPPGIDELLSEAAGGPMVIFVASEYRSDALLVAESGVRSIELSELSLLALVGRINAFQRAMRVAAGRGSGPREREEAEAQLGNILEWLWDTAARPALDALGLLSGPAPTEELPRVWWMPGGLLARLPLHAAGRHRDANGSTVMDRVVSSYSPSIRALRYARRRVTALGASPPGSLRTLIVAMPTTPGQDDLYYVTDEVRALRAVLPDSILLTTPGRDGIVDGAQETPTKAAVLARLGECQILHFSCHGEADTSDPSQSSLHLCNHADDPLTVAALSSVEHDHARLAYLSACSTAVNFDSTLMHEAIHIAAALQLVGFPHVIGTLWEVGDSFSAKLAATFYGNLHNSSRMVDVSRSAFALHNALREARDQNLKVVSSWSPYIHMGA